MALYSECRVPANHSSVIEDGYPCIRYGELYTTYRTKFEKTVSFVTKELFDKCHKIHTGDVAMTLTGENKTDIAMAVTYEGKDTIAMGGDMTCWSHHMMNPLYLVYFINSPYAISCKRNLATGDIIIHISNDKLATILMPVPPLEEQHRIVAKIEEILSYIDQYDKAYTKLETFNKKFPEDMKKSILQMAMQGKLVEQRSEEGTADELYEQIVAEKAQLIKDGKIKKEKPLPEITEDEIPFDIPSSWKWVRLGTIVSVYGGKRIPAGTRLSENDTGHKYIRVADMKDETVSLDDIKYITDEIYEKIKQYFITSDDIYITVAGTIGRVGVVPRELNNANLTENADKLVFRRLDKMYLCRMLNSEVVQHQIREATTQVGQPKLAIARIQKLIVPLPPLEEQKRIVAKIEELLPYCDQLIKN